MHRVACCVLIGLVAFGSPADRIQAAPASDEAWLSRARDRLAEREYQVSDSGNGLQAPNRAQGFRTYFQPEAIGLAAREGDDEPWAYLWLSDFGSEGRVITLGTAIRKVDGSRVDYHWPGLQARYVNRPDGLTQTLVIEDAAEAGSDICVELGASGAKFEPGHDAIRLSGREHALRLTLPVARDSTQRELPVVVQSKGNTLSIRIEAADAHYPITIESVVNRVVDGLLQSNQVNAQFGISVDGAGDVNGDGYADVIVGARFYDNGESDEGAAFIYFGGPGAFNTVPDAVLESNQVLALFGGAVAGAGDVNGDGYDDVVVGAQWYDNGQTNEGAAFVYLGGPGLFDTTPDALLESNQASSFYGYGVDGAGDVNGDGYADVLVGAQEYDDGEENEGAAFLYFGGPGAFNTTADAHLQANQGSAFFGRRVAGAGDVNGDGYADVVVGASYFDNGQSEEGAAFLYFGGAGTFDTTADALLESNQIGAYFGHSVGAAGDVNGDGYADLIIGAWRYDNGQADEGAAFLYYGGAGTFNTTPDAILEGNATGALAGNSVSGAGDINGDGYADVIVGAVGLVTRNNVAGGALVYFGRPGTFDATDDLLIREPDQDNGALGSSVAVVGDVNGDGLADVVVGAQYFDNGQTDEGVAFLYYGAPLGPDFRQDYALVESNQASASFGVQVAGCGDVNGDGYDDVIVGANVFDDGQADEGAAFLYFGGPGAFDVIPDAVLQADQPNAGFGVAVAGAGDVNGDGYADVLVGAPRYDLDQPYLGAAFVYHGGPGAFNTTADVKLVADRANAELFGLKAAGAGDVNGDGFADVIIGADQWNGNPGAVYLFLGGNGGLDTSFGAFLAPANAFTTNFGTGLAAAGDVNGDGFGDIAIGANGYSNGQNAEGAAFLYFGGAGPFNTVADAVLEPNAEYAWFGTSVAGAGDINGDGYSDIVVGAPYFTNGQTNEGAVYIYLGGPGAFDLTADTRLEVNNAFANLGAAVAGAGDVNGDGYADILMGAPEYSSTASNEGAWFLRYGEPALSITTYHTSHASGQAIGRLGFSVAGAGDINGDGHADFIAGARTYTNGQNFEGTAFIYPGTAHGRLVSSAQRRGDASRRVELSGSAHQADGFVVSLNATSPRGRERSRLQVEACPDGVPFGSLLCDIRTATTWSEIGANAQGVAVSLPLNGLNMDRLYHWRARVQYAPLHVTAAGIAAPPNPQAGPWRRLHAGGDVIDIRTNVPPPLPELIFGNGFEQPPP